MAQQKITTFLTFNDQAEEAVNLYCSLFKKSKIVSLSRWGEGGQLPKGTAMSIVFELFGQRFYALNAGPYFTFSNGISLFALSDSQDEVDMIWDKLSDGGQVLECGWVKDKFGVHWQVIPKILGKYMSDPDKEKSMRVMKAMWGMKKLDFAGLEQAYQEGEGMITVKATVEAPIAKVWKCWTEATHIKAWTFASDDWHAPLAENEL